MREITVTAYEAFDGARFDVQQKCREYEDARLPERVSNLKTEQIQAAIDGGDPDLGDAIERLASLIRNARKSRGDLRWHPKRFKDRPQPSSEEAAA